VLQKKEKRTQLNNKNRRTFAVKTTLVIIAIPIMLILSVSNTSLLSSPSPSSYSTHSVYAQQSADNLNKNTANVNVEGNNYPMKYNITNNARVSSIVPQKEAAKLIVTIEPTKEGKLTINLPRELIDYKIAGNKDGNFIVQVNAKQVSNFKEIIPSTTGASNNSRTSRTLEINFGPGDRTIEIIGTQMAQASVATIKKQAQKEQAAAVSAATAAAINKTKESSSSSTNKKTMTNNITTGPNTSQVKTNASQAGGTGALILNKTGEAAKTIANKTTGILSNITKNLVGGK
jgi:hypothetical protein